MTDLCKYKYFLLGVERGPILAVRRNRMNELACKNPQARGGIKEIMQRSNPPFGNDLIRFLILQPLLARLKKRLCNFLATGWQV
jgi:hypothetical protein